MTILYNRRRYTVRLAAVAACTLSAVSAVAGGYMMQNTTTGAPVKWNNSVVLNYDQGPLSATVNNATAATMVNNAVQRWTSSQIADCVLTITRGTDLATDNANGTSAAPDFNPGTCNGINPVIYDQNGLLTDAALGAGANQSTLGFARPYCTNGPVQTHTTIVKGEAVINGLFLDGAAGPGDVTQAQMEGVISHEIGHMLNLDHAQCGAAEAVGGPATYTPNFQGFPSMYPLVHADQQDLELDDKVWISNLHPSSTGLTKTKITGVARSSADPNTVVNGINIVARSATNPQDMINCVCGYKAATGVNQGVYDIPMLPASSQWVLDIEPILSDFTDGSSVGPVDPPLVLSSPAEFLNDSTQESNSDSVVKTTTFITPSAGGTLSGVDIRLNNTVTPQSVNLSATANFLTPTTLTVTPGVPLQVNSSISGSDGGNLSPNGDDVEEWYVLSPPAGLEVTKVVLTPSGFDGDLVIASYDEANGFVYYPRIVRSAGVGGTETVEGFFNTQNFGTGASTGKLFIGVSTPGTATGNYTLRVDASVSDKDALVVNRPANINPAGGVVTVTGRGFKNTGGTPTVTFNNPGLQVNSVTFVNSGQLNVNVSRLAGFIPGSTADLEVTNPAGSGAYSGRTAGVTAVPVTLSNFSAE